MTYTFSSTQNNGKITSQSDAISGETIQYTYDSLNRLASAQSTSGSWGQSYSYDGFGNLTGQTVTAGSAPAYSAVFNAATNQPSGYGVADANGNMNGFGNYDVANQFIGQYGNFQYSYAPGNKRVWRGVWTSGTLTTDEVTFWSPSGQKLATYQMKLSGTQWYAAQTGTNYYFGRKLIKNAGGYVGADRLGSIGHFYPWGQEKPSATQNGTEKFTGYFRDAETGLDYAVNRVHDPGTGRFLTPDFSYRSVRATDPGSWNRYAYVGGDPINRVDPAGLCDVVVGGITESSASNTGDSDFANSIGAMMVFPYAGTDVASGLVGVAVNAATSNAWSAVSVAAAINEAAADSSGPIDIFTFSGGAQAFDSALSGGYLSASVISRIQSITYASPGLFGTLSTVNGITPTVILGTGPADLLATAGATIPTGWNVMHTNCLHDAECEFAAANAAASAGNACNTPATISAPGIGTIAALNTSLQYLSSFFTSMASYNPLAYLNSLSMVTTSITYDMGPVGCVTTPGLNGGPPETVCQ